MCQNKVHSDATVLWQHVEVSLFDTPRLHKYDRSSPICVLLALHWCLCVHKYDDLSHKLALHHGVLVHPPPELALAIIRYRDKVETETMYYEGVHFGS